MNSRSIITIYKFGNLMNESDRLESDHNGWLGLLRMEKTGIFILSIWLQSNTTVANRNGNLL